MDRSLAALLSDLQLPGHLALAEHWLDLYTAAGRRVPLRRAIDPLRFAPALKDAWIVDAEPDGRFRIRLGGETLNDWYGFSTAGRFYEEVFTPAILPLLTEQTRHVLETPCIGYHRMHSSLPDHTVPVAFERLALPLAADDGQIRHMIGATRFLDGTGLGRGDGSIETEIACWYSLSGS